MAEIWAEQLIAQKVVSKQEVDQQTSEVWDELTRLHQRLKAQIRHAEEVGQVEQPTGEYTLDRTPSPDVKTAVSAERLRILNKELLAIPEGFTVHPKLVKQLERRRDALGPDGGIDWAHAESLAFASLLTEGTPIRLTGQDVERGTFSQRHAVLHDAKTGQTICPIQSLPGALAPFELHNSPLSEVACLGFEYGYSAEAPETLVLWEAQFGDFVNCAQVIVDQFIVSGLAKWGQTSRLVLLLPHGYEGSGPEHSSGRLERFLTLASEGNIRVANVTTPAQYFHLIRRQARIAKQRPLILMTPKSLLRLPQATNRIEHLSETKFFPVLAEPRVPIEQVKRLVLCTGKVYYDLVGHPRRAEVPGVAVGRVELLYPFPQAQILELIESYPNLEEVVWAQEEPRNMGARAHMFPRLMQILPERLKFGYIGRPERASPGEGYPAAHIAEQSRIVETALDLAIPVSLYPRQDAGRALDPPDVGPASSAARVRLPCAGHGSAPRRTSAHPARPADRRRLLAATCRRRASAATSSPTRSAARPRRTASAARARATRCAAWAATTCSAAGPRRTRSTAATATTASTAARATTSSSARRATTTSTASPATTASTAAPATTASTASTATTSCAAARATTSSASRASATSG